MKKIVIAAGLALALYIPVARADWALGGYLGALSFDQEKALEEGVEDSALTIGFVADAFQDRFMLSMGFGFVSYEDNEEFEQLVEFEGGFDDGEVRTESSDAMGFLLHIDAGPRFQLGESRGSFFAIKGGVSSMVLSERTISNCSNCYSEDIDIDGGPYVQTALGFGSERISASLRYSHYIDEADGIENSFGLAVSGMF